MKKKTLFVLLVIVGVFIISGCGSNNNTIIDNTNETTKEDSKKLSIDNIEVKLDGKASFNKITYTYPKDASSSNLGTYAIMDLMNQGDLLVRVAMSYFPNKTMGEVLQGTSLTSVDALTFNSNIWNIYKGTQPDGKTTMNYVTVYEGDVYSIAFISDKNINDFINAFMGNVNFN